jgi:copper chaperone CopZ
MDIQVENIKCTSCVKTIIQKMESIVGIEKCTVDVESGIVAIEGSSINSVLVHSTLKGLGYPKVGDGSLLNKAKSFVSCATGLTKG